MSTPKEMKSPSKWAAQLYLCTTEEEFDPMARDIQADVLEWCIQECQKQFIGVPKTICEKHAELTKGKE